MKKSKTHRRTTMPLSCRGKLKKREMRNNGLKNSNNLKMSNKKLKLNKN